MSHKEGKTNLGADLGGQRGHESLWFSEGRGEQEAQVTKVSGSVLAPG